MTGGREGRHWDGVGAENKCQKRENIKQNIDEAEMPCHRGV